MKTYVTDTQVSADLHGGAFMWETFQIVCSISDDGTVTWIYDPVVPQQGHMRIHHGLIVERGKHRWMQIELTVEPNGIKLDVYALAVEQLLICQVYSVLDRAGRSYLFRLQP